MSILKDMRRINDILSQILGGLGNFEMIKLFLKQSTIYLIDQVFN